MKIERYEFGKIIVDGKTYNKDLILTADKVYPNWWRKEGHKLQLEDILEILELEQPEVLIVGTGYFGLMKVMDDVKSYLNNKGIKLIEGKTGDVWKVYNKLAEEKAKVVAAFHLTC